MRRAHRSTGGFGKWGSSILSTAATSVSTFTNQVYQSKAPQTEDKHDSPGVGGIFSGVSAIAKAVEATASNSNTYIQDGFQLLVPILQLLAVQQKLD
ncbi:hypothetical protein MRX96_026569 [Rhipicephalus microplus]